jgi:hypothetical protein
MKNMLQNKKIKNKKKKKEDGEISLWPIVVLFSSPLLAQFQA